jgi:predicted enzyme related to lactoylglutathione lyase
MLTLVVIRSRDLENLAKFYSALGLCFVRHQHGTGPDHLSTQVGETVFEIYPVARPEESTVATRLGFSVPCLATTLNRLRGLNATVVAEPSDTPFGRQAIVKDFDGHKVELYEEKKNAE